MKTLKLADIKRAIVHDGRFRELFPELKSEFIEVLNNPGCACNAPVFKKVLEFRDRIKSYFPNREVSSIEEELKQTINNWKVINCHIDKLEGIMNNLHRTGRKQVALSRWEDQVTILINDLGW